MKKILVTTLALSLAAVSMVDAKSRKSGRKMAAAPAAAMSKTDENRENLSGFMDQLQNAINDKDYDAARSLLPQVINAAKNDTNVMKSLILWQQRTELDQQIKTLEAKRDAEKNQQSWFSRITGWTDADYKQLENDIRDKKTTLKTLEGDIKKEAQKGGVENSKVAKVAAGLITTAAIMIAGADVYFYGEEGRVIPAYRKVRENLPTVEGAKKFYKRVAPGFMGGEAAAE